MIWYNHWFTLHGQEVLCFEENQNHSYVDESDVDYPNRVILMQYTGLKDKNGKEIYEGDIIRNRENGCVYNGGIGIVEFVANNQEGHPINGYWATLHDEAFHIYPKQCEVIGNRFENPELLK